MQTLNCYRCGSDTGIPADDDNSEALCWDCNDHEGHEAEEAYAAEPATEWKTCRNCNGSGEDPMTERQCRECYGEGMVEYDI